MTRARSMRGDTRSLPEALLFAPSPFSGAWVLPMNLKKNSEIMKVKFVGFHNFVFHADAGQKLAKHQLSNFKTDHAPSLNV